MSKIDEMLARLETSAVKFDVGRGGIPELTPQDIAAALGLCENRFAVTIYQAIYGGTIHWPEIDKEIARAQFAEWKERMDRMVLAQLSRATAAMAPKGERGARVAHADQLIAGAKAAMWPQLTEDVYARVRMGVMTELRTNQVCARCAGRCAVMVGTVLEQCKQCVGTGRTSISDRQRAAMIQVDESSYRRTWRPMYEWLYRMLTDAAATGRKQFSDALERTIE